MDIEVKFFRWRKTNKKSFLFPKPNVGRKGQFTKKFNSIEELVNYCTNSVGTVYIASENLTKQQRQIFRDKYINLVVRKYENV